MDWKLKPEAPNDFLRKFKKQYSGLTLQLLYNRGIKTQKEIEEFFDSDYRKYIYSPFKLKDMKKGAERVLRAIDQSEKVVIYGDYDADGVCSAAILYRTLQDLGLSQVEVYIPDREIEGHGLNDKSVKWIIEHNTKLVITVDCGSRDTKEIEQLAQENIDVIVTDHHEVGQKLPPVVALINPYRPDDKYPFTSLSGAGVAFKLASALYWTKENGCWDSSKCKITKTSPFVLSESVKWFLDITALATVADVMPLLCENRILVKYGLGVLAQTKWAGLRKLMKTAQIEPEITSPSQKGEAPMTNLDSYTLGFLLGPRLNAAGRIDHANIAFYLLIADEDSEAEELAEKVNGANYKRQQRLEKTVKEAEEHLNQKYQKKELPELICEGNSRWSVGLLGLIAGKLSRKYNRPAIIYKDGEDLVSASCRSVTGFDIVDLLDQHSSFFDDYGGHKAAAGFRMKREKFDELKQLLLNTVKKNTKNKTTEPVIEIDKVVSLEEINWDNYNTILKIAPFGKANPVPVFLAKNLEVRDWRVVGNGGKHLKLDLAMFGEDSSSAKTFKAIAFGAGDIWPEQLSHGSTIDIVFELIANHWNGYKNLEFKIIDIKLKETQNSKFKTQNQIYT